MANIYRFAEMENNGIEDKKESFAPDMKQYRDVMELKNFNFRYAEEIDKKDFQSVLTGKSSIKQLL